MEEILQNNYDEEKAKAKVLVCDECTEEFLLSSVVIEELKIHDTSSMSNLSFKYFKCPKCPKYYLIEVDDDVTRVLLNKCVRLAAKIGRLINKKRNVPDELVNQLDRRKNALNKRRRKLLSKYSQAFTEIAKIKLG